MASERPTFLTPTNLVALVILLASAIWLAWWFIDRARFVYVTDARISATMLNISSRIPGWVEDFPLEEGELVAPGETLVRIDARETRMELSEVEAKLETLAAEEQKRRLELDLTRKQVESAIETQRSKVEAARAALSEARVERQRASRELARATSLLEQNMISNDEFEAREANDGMSREALHRYEAELAAARAELLSAEANLAQLDVLEQSVEIAARERREVEIERERLSSRLEDHVIRSAIHGVVDETFINPGEYVYPGQRILMLHNPEDVWVKANIKETDIRKIRLGSPVNVSIDAYPDVEVTGRVTQVGTSANSEFAMLPSPNPSGNFTKITQRVGVRVDLGNTGLPLKPGMMVELRIPVDGEAEPAMVSQHTSP